MECRMELECFTILAMYLIYVSFDYFTYWIELYCEYGLQDIGYRIWSMEYRV